jgi:hypothetical protein
MEVVSFRVTGAIKDSFVYVNRTDAEDTLGMRKPSWVIQPSSTAQYLTEALDRQCKYNNYILDKQVKSCQKKKDAISTRFVSTYDSHAYFLKMDQAILSGTGQQEVYAIVLLGKSGYLGHAYVYRSSNRENHAFIAGSRHRVDSLFISLDPSESPEGGLLEGARRVSLIKGMDHLSLSTAFESVSDAGVYIGVPTTTQLSRFSLLE